MLSKQHSPYKNRALEKTVEERDAARKELIARIEQVAALTADCRNRDNDRARPGQVMKITLAEQVLWIKEILEDKRSRLAYAKSTFPNWPGVVESAQIDYDCALAVMATLFTTVNAQQAVKKP